MKDFRLSEIMSYCYSNGDCKQCELEKICSHGLDYISTCNIEPRDMIELPCKVRFEDKMTGKTIISWQVLSRKDGGYVGSDWFTKEEEADEFLQELKNGKV